MRFARIAVIVVMGGCSPQTGDWTPPFDAGCTACVGAGGGPTGSGGGAPDTGGGKACVPKTCADNGKNCGSFYTGCGQVNCGVCGYPTRCGGDTYEAWKRNEVPNVCGVW